MRGQVHCIAHPTARGYVVLAEFCDGSGERSRIGWWCATEADAEQVLRIVRGALASANADIAALLSEVNRPPFVLARGALPTVKQSGIVARTELLGSKVRDRSGSE